MHAMHCFQRCVVKPGCADLSEERGERFTQQSARASPSTMHACPVGADTARDVACSGSGHRRPVRRAPTLPPAALATQVRESLLEPILRLWEQHERLWFCGCKIDEADLALYDLEGEAGRRRRQRGAVIQTRDADH